MLMGALALSAMFPVMDDDDNYVSAGPVDIDGIGNAGYEMFLGPEVTGTLGMYKLVYSIITKPSIDGNGTVALMGWDTNNIAPSGAMEIPSTVTNLGNTYDVVEIGSKAFQTATDLDYSATGNTLTIPSTVKEIGADAFTVSANFKNLSFGDDGLGTVPLVGNGIFSYGSTSQNRPSPTTDDTYFNYDPTAQTAPLKFAKVVDNDGNTIAGKKILVGYVKDNDSRTNITAAEMEGVIAIGQNAFGHTSIAGNITSIELPDTLKTISANAFYNTKIISMTLPESVENVSSLAFSRTLTSLSISPESTLLKMVGDVVYSYDGKRVVASVPSISGDLNILSGVVSIENNAFHYGRGLTGTITLPDTLTHVGNYAFAYCENLTGTLNLPNSITTIGRNAFQNCESFTGDLIIPENVTTIKESTFQNCEGFTGTLSLPDGLLSVGTSAFSYCKNLTGTLTLPDSMTSIGTYAFLTCEEFTGDLIIPDSLTTIGSSAFNGCKGFETLILPDTLTHLDQNAIFANCSGLTEIVLSENLKVIGNDVFNACESVVEITIPSSVESIGTRAFANCTSLNELFFEGSTCPAIGNNISIPATTTVYCHYSVDQTFGIGSFVWNTNILSTKGVYYNIELAEGSEYEFEQVSAKVGFVGARDHIISDAKIQSWIPDYAEGYTIQFYDDSASTWTDLSVYALTTDINSIGRYTGTVKFDDSNTTGAMMPSDQLVIYGIEGTLSLVTGITDSFGGWNSLQDGTGTDYVDGSSTLLLDFADGTNDGVLTLYAQVMDQNNKNDITFYHGSLIIDSLTMTDIAEGQRITLPDYSTSGYAFLGWNTQMDGMGTTYAAGTAFAMGSIDVSLYAVLEQYQITYYGNGATLGYAGQHQIGGTNNGTDTIGGDTALSNGGTLYLDGYYLSGWNTAADGTGTSYALGAAYYVSQNMEFYAVWTANPIPPAPTPTKTYVITATYDPGATVTPSGTITVTRGSDMTFRFSPVEGYVVSAVTIDGVQLSQAQIDLGYYTFSNVMMNHTIHVSNTRVSTTLTVEISEGKGHVEYSVNGGTFRTYSSPVVIAEHATLVLRAYADDGYEFREWIYDSASDKNSEITFNDVMSTIDVQVYFSESSGSGDDFPWLWIVAIVLIILVILVAIGLLLRRKRLKA